MQESGDATEPPEARGSRLPTVLFHASTSVGDARDTRSRPRPLLPVLQWWLAGMDAFLDQAATYLTTPFILGMPERLVDGYAYAEKRGALVRSVLRPSGDAKAEFRGFSANRESALCRDLFAALDASAALEPNLRKLKNGTATPLVICTIRTCVDDTRVARATLETGERLSTEDVAVLLGRTSRTIRSMLRSGLIGRSVPYQRTVREGERESPFAIPRAQFFAPAHVHSPDQAFKGSEWLETEQL